MRTSWLPNSSSHSRELGLNEHGLCRVQLLIGYLRLIEANGRRELWNGRKSFVFQSLGGFLQPIFDRFCGFA